MYMKNILVEQDLRSPHCYLDNSFKLDFKYNCVLDCGAAEGFFSLDCIDDVERVVLVECDKEWIEALQHTFKDYGDKVIIIEKVVSNIDSEDSITIDCIDDEYNVSFIKMDIEGYERYAVDGMKKYLRKKKNNGGVICTYHRPEDAANFKKIFGEHGYECLFTDGLIYISQIVAEGEVISDYDFRKGVLRVKKVIEDEINIR